MQLVDCASGLRRVEKMLIDIQGRCNGAVDGAAALADEEQAKGYLKSDTVANRS
jgi:hypothetical protein